MIRPTQSYASSFTSKNVVNLFIAYELDVWSQDLNIVFTLKDCFFRVVKLTKNNESDKYSYSKYVIGSDSRSLFSISNCWVKKYYFWSIQYFIRPY